MCVYVCVRACVHVCVCVCVCGDGPVDVHVSGLPYAVAAVLCLCIHGRVPVGVIEHDRVCPRQVHSQATTPCGEDEAENSLITVEPLHQHLPTGVDIDACCNSMHAHCTEVLQ